jgi:hypothetical protein
LGDWNNGIVGLKKWKYFSSFIPILPLFHLSMIPICLLLSFFDLHENLSVMEDPDAACLFGDDNSQCIGQSGNSGGCTVTASEAQWNFDILP